MLFILDISSCFLILIKLALVTDSGSLLTKTKRIFPPNIQQLVCRVSWRGGGDRISRQAGCWRRYHRRDRRYHRTHPTIAQSPYLPSTDSAQLQPSIVNNKVYFITIGPMMPPDWVDVISTYLARMHICVIIAETNAVDINQIKENLRTRTHVFLHIFLTQSGIF